MLNKLACVVMSALGVSVLAMASVRQIPAEPRSSSRTNAMTTAAIEFLDQLRPELRERAVLPLNDANRKDWHFVPRERKGLSLKNMNNEERRAARRLMRSCLSDAGYLKAETIMELELALREAAEARGRQAPHRDPELYYFTIFGTPGDGPWGWRVEGHHLSLNFSAATQTLIAVTPAFMGANPAEVLTGRRAGWRVLAAEEDVGRAILHSLDDEQRAAAVISDRAPRDILLAPGQAADRLGEPQGLAMSAMNEDQRSLVMDLISVYISNLENSLDQAQLDRIVAAGIENIHFAWSGSDKAGEGHYYRLHGPTFVIEYDNIQGGANHIHSVFRDLENDFGGDALAEHYRNHHSSE